MSTYILIVLESSMSTKIAGVFKLKRMCDVKFSFEKKVEPKPWVMREFGKFRIGVYDMFRHDFCRQIKADLPSIDEDKVIETAYIFKEVDEKVVEKEAVVEVLGKVIEKAAEEESMKDIYNYDSGSDSESDSESDCDEDIDIDYNTSMCNV